MVEVCYPNLSKWSVYCFAVLLFHKFYHNKCIFHLATGANLWILLGPSKNATSATSAKPRDGSFLRWQRWWAHCTWNRHSMLHNPDFAPNKGILRRAQHNYAESGWWRDREAWRVWGLMLSQGWVNKSYK